MLKMPPYAIPTRQGATSVIAISCVMADGSAEAVALVRHEGIPSAVGRQT
jgi:hypothetical protein